MGGTILAGDACARELMASEAADGGVGARDQFEELAHDLVDQVGELARDLLEEVLAEVSDGDVRFAHLCIASAPASPAIRREGLAQLLVL